MSGASRTPYYACEESEEDSVIQETEEVDSQNDDNQMAFVELLSSYPVLLEKSQKPHVKVQKIDAIESLRQLLQTKYAKIYTRQQLLKKIANMKKIVKEKTDVKKTGNRKITLKPWERMMFELLQGDINPIFCRIQGAISSGLQSTQKAESVNFPKEAVSSNSYTPTPAIKPKRKRLVEETDETSKLTTSELQRLVLLEQLKYYRMKTRNLMEKSADIFTKRNQESQQLLHEMNQCADYDAYVIATNNV